MAGKPWYNNGIEEIQVGNTEAIPDGYIKGRKPLTPEQKQIKINKYLDTIGKVSLAYIEICLNNKPLDMLESPQSFSYYNIE